MVDPAKATRVLEPDPLPPPAPLTLVGHRPRTLLSFDLEECDIPLEYGTDVSPERQLEITTEGLPGLLALLDRLDIRATFFTTAHYALHRQQQVAAIAERHEIASHGCFHKGLRPGDLERSRDVLQSITGQPVEGFRMARMAPVDGAQVRAAGYRYCSSENPTWLPGRYNRFFARRTTHTAHGVVQIPASVTPLLRFPLFWLSVKNFPPSLIRAAARWVLAHDRYLSLYFHPWEFADLSGLGLPWFVAGRDGERMLARLRDLLAWLAARSAFVTYADHVASLDTPHA